MPFGVREACGCLVMVHDIKSQYAGVIMHNDDCLTSTYHILLMSLFFSIGNIMLSAKADLHPAVSALGHIPQLL